MKRGIFTFAREETFKKYWKNIDYTWNIKRVRNWKKIFTKSQKNMPKLHTEKIRNVELKKVARCRMHARHVHCELIPQPRQRIYTFWYALRSESPALSIVLAREEASVIGLQDFYYPAAIPREDCLRIQTGTMPSGNSRRIKPNVEFSTNKRMLTDHWE